MNSQRAVDSVGSTDNVGTANSVGSGGAVSSGSAVDPPLGADLYDQLIQQLFAIGLAMQSTQRKEKSPEQALRISGHIDQLHNVLEQLRKRSG